MHNIDNGLIAREGISTYFRRISFYVCSKDGKTATLYFTANELVIKCPFGNLSKKIDFEQAKQLDEKLASDEALSIRDKLFNGEFSKI
jgi:hypothetical protein